MQEIITTLVELLAAGFLIVAGFMISVLMEWVDRDDPLVDVLKEHIEWLKIYGGFFK